MSRSGLAPEGAGAGERWLARLWQDASLPPAALRTRDGRHLRVVFRGLPNAGPGPDFRHAIIATEEGLLRGDVEVHVLASDFRRHRHHLDPAYDGLALHVVLWDDEGRDTVLACGRRVPVVAVGPHLEAPRPPAWREPCRTSLERLGAREAARRLDKMGEMRLRQKAHRLRAEMAALGREEALYRALAEACGYGGNEVAFAAVARALPWSALRPRLVGAAATDAPSLALRLLSAHVPTGEQGRQRCGRPANALHRRLGAWAGLLAGLAGAGLTATLLPPVRAADPRRLLRALLVRGPWGSIGRERAVEMAVNAVLPFALALAEEARQRDLERAVLRTYRSLPRPGAYGCTRHLDEALAGEVWVGAQRQQGMLYLYRHYCSQGGCGRCPLS
ncbi:MAG TPA: DUF2851 family protein [Dehalococcoidia bacterium]|nr:DUF2851 family protein [Dehalococcoidia bacterium]